MFNFVSDAFFVFQIRAICLLEMWLRSHCSLVQHTTLPVSRVFRNSHTFLPFLPWNMCLSISTRPFSPSLFYKQFHYCCREVPWLHSMFSYKGIPSTSHNWKILAALLPNFHWLKLPFWPINCQVYSLMLQIFIFLIQ